MEYSSELPLKLRFEYDSPPRLQLMYAHGVFGGINSHGEIEMNFYTESDKLPDHSERRIRPDGGLDPEISLREEGGKTIIRHFHTKVLINHQTAKALLAWLEEKIELLDQESTRAHAPLGSDDTEPTQ